MSDRIDLAVVGGGLAGAVAAAVAREAGMAVTLVRKGYGATALSSGALDLIEPDGAPLWMVSGPAAASFRDASPALGSSLLGMAKMHAMARLVQEEPGHPLVRIDSNPIAGWSPHASSPMTLAARVSGRLLRGMPAELALAESAAAPEPGTAARESLASSGTGGIPYDSCPWHGSIGLYVTAAGECRFADVVQRSIAPGELTRSRAGTVLVATLPMLAGWHAATVVEGIRTPRERYLTGLVGGADEWPVSPAGTPASVRAQDLARFFDSPEGEAALLAAIRRPPGPPPRCVLFPPVLGFTRTRELRARLEEAFGCPCAEVLATIPSVPGFRLQSSLDAGLRRLGVEIVTGVATGVAAGRLDLRVALPDGSARSLTPRAIVLATGKFLGGGLTRDGALRETVFGLPVNYGGRRVDGQHPMRLTSERRNDPQALLKAGVAVDADMRPRGEDDSIHAAGLFAAGAVLADWAYPDRGCGLLLAGALACRAAAKALEHLGIQPGAPLAPPAPAPSAEPAR